MSSLRWAFVCLLGAALSLGSAAPLPAASLPPVGERIYCLPSPRALGPLAIKSLKDKEIKGSSTPCFQDPAPLTHKSAEPPKAMPAKIEAKPTQEIVSEGSQVKLAPLQVKGRLRQPRLPWTGRASAMERSEEPMPGGFVDKIFRDVPEM